MGRYMDSCLPVYFGSATITQMEIYSNYRRMCAHNFDSTSAKSTTHKIEEVCSLTQSQPKIHKRAHTHSQVYNIWIYMIMPPFRYFKRHFFHVLFHVNFTFLTPATSPPLIFTALYILLLCLYPPPLSELRPLCLYFILLLSLKTNY